MSSVFRRLFRNLLRLLPALPALALAANPGGPDAGRPAPVSTGVRLETGEIEGAKFVIARPAVWNGCALLLAHGLRDEKAPLVADLNPGRLEYRTLLDEGWIVAKTSYRRNGMIIRDAIADLENLRAHIAATCGEPRRVVLEGDSMGGAIVTLIAEQFAGHFQGAVAVGAALQSREKKNPLAFNLQPQIPLVFLSSEGDLTGPQKYVTAPFDRQIRPLLLKVRREGLGNVNQGERLASLRALMDLIDHQPVALPAASGGPTFFDATREPVPGPSQVRFLDEGGFEARVTEASPIPGGLVLNVQPSDFSAADIAPGTWFELIARGQSHRVLYGRDFKSVTRNAWVAFPNADGFFDLARDAADAAAGPDVGDAVIVRRIPDDSAPTPR